MVYYNDIRKKNQAYIFYLNQFAEYQIGRTKAYLGWFTERFGRFR